MINFVKGEIPLIVLQTSSVLAAEIWRATKMKTIWNTNLLRKLLVAAALAAGINALGYAADKPNPNPEDPLAVLQGKWYAAREKVSLELKGNEIVGVENTSEAHMPNQAKLKPGLVVARLGPHKFDPNRKMVIFSGECWTMGGGRPGYNLQPCTETASAYLETRGPKPRWSLNLMSLLLVRQEDLKDWLSSRQ